jgi:hypothetical protein
VPVVKGIDMVDEAMRSAGVCLLMYCRIRPDDAWTTSDDGNLMRAVAEDDSWSRRVRCRRSVTNIENIIPRKTLKLSVVTTMKRIGVNCR